MQPETENPGGTGTQLRTDAKQMGNAAANRLHSELDARKGTAAAQAKSLSTAIDRAAGEIDDGAPAWLKSAFQQGAQQVQRFADALEQKDSRQIFDEVGNFARNSPGTFLGACAAAGFVAARVFKAGGEQPADSTASAFNSDPATAERPAFGQLADEPSSSTPTPGAYV